MFVFVGWAIDYQTAMQTRCSGFALREPLCHPSLFHSSWINLLLLCVCVCIHLQIYIYYAYKYVRSLLCYTPVMFPCVFQYKHVLRTNCSCLEADQVGTPRTLNPAVSIPLTIQSLHSGGFSDLSFGTKRVFLRWNRLL